jgi:hypothetical protein
VNAKPVEVDLNHSLFDEGDYLLDDGSVVYLSPLLNIHGAFKAARQVGASSR